MIIYGGTVNVNAESLFNIAGIKHYQMLTFHAKITQVILSISSFNTKNYQSVRYERKLVVRKKLLLYSFGYMSKAYGLISDTRLPMGL